MAVVLEWANSRASPGQTFTLYALVHCNGTPGLVRHTYVAKRGGVTGLAEGPDGLVLKLHHSLADGLAAVRIAGGLLDVTSEARSPAPPPWQPRLEPALTAGAAAFLRDGPVSRARRPGIAVGVLT